jgi:hypothetical protein
MVLAACKLYLLIRKANFNPSQPRVPAGDPGGGRWTDTGSAAGPSARTPSQPTSRAPTEADMRKFVQTHRPEAQRLALALGGGATADEFLALSSVETTWGTSDAAQMANNYFGLHNAETGPFPGQIGTYLTSGKRGVPGKLLSKWIAPLNDGSSRQAVAAFSSTSGYMDSGAVAVRRLTKIGGDYSNPATFFATIRRLGWAAGTPSAEYVRTLLSRHKHVSRY